MLLPKNIGGLPIGGYVEAAESKLRKRPQYAHRIGLARANQEIDIGGVPGKSVPRNGERADDQILNFVRVQALDKLAQIPA